MNEYESSKRLKMNINKLYSFFHQHRLTTTDSRQIERNAIFFALKGGNFNGNLFAAKALEGGCAYAVVDDAEVCQHMSDRFVLVDDVLTAYQDFAREHRRHFRHPVIEITGTNGKTTTKELTAAVLSEHFNTLATEANYNNHIGVPRTLLRLTDDHEIAVIETGANHPGEIKTLANIVEPEYGIITNVGRAHLEGFGSFEGVCRTKGELYDFLRAHNGIAFVNANDGKLMEMAQGLKTVKYGLTGTEDCLVEGEIISCSPWLNLRWRKSGSEKWHEVATHFIGSYNLANALAAACIGTYFGVTEEEVCKALSEYEPHNNRSEMRKTDKGNQLIIDAYNANPTSMKAALDSFKLMEGKGKMAILGEMRELGEASAEEHRKVIAQLKESDIETIWLVGEEFQKLTPEGMRTFANAEEVATAIREEGVPSQLLLIKGSNGTKLWTLPELL